VRRSIGVSEWVAVNGRRSFAWGQWKAVNGKQLIRGVLGAETCFIMRLTHNCGNLTS